MSDTEADDASFFVVDSHGANYMDGTVSFESFSSIGIQGKYAELYEKGKTSTSDIRAHMAGLLHLGRTLPADPVVMDRQSPRRRRGAVLVAHERDRVVAGCQAFHRDDGLLLQLVRGGAGVAPGSFGG